MTTHQSTPVASTSSFVANVAALLAAVFILHGGMCGIIPSAVGLRRSAQLSRMKSVDGVIKASDVIAQKRRRFMDYSVRVAFSYVVAGNEYTSTAYGFEPQLTVDTPVLYDAGSEDDALQFASRYRAGGSVRVYYDTNDPAKACLQPTYLRHRLFLALAVDIVEVLLAAALIVLARRLRPRAQRATVR